MQAPKFFYGATEADLWQQLQADLAAEVNLFQYTAVLEQQSRKVVLDIDIDPGGGFEGGYAFTRLSAPVLLKGDFTFHLHDEGFLADVGKWLGMQDVTIGYPDLDEKIIVKTNNKDRLVPMFADAAVREVFGSLSNFNLQLKKGKEENEAQTFLELEIEAGITEPDYLRKIYNAFYTLLTVLETTPADE